MANIKCEYCKGKATLLCDGLLPRWMNNPLLREVATVDNWRKGMDQRRQMLTCDRPLCRGCAISGGAFHVSGAKGYFETIDYCQDCVPNKDP